MKKVGYFILGLIAGAAGMRFCMTNEKAQDFFKKARKKGEEILGKSDNSSNPLDDGNEEETSNPESEEEKK